MKVAIESSNIIRHANNHNSSTIAALTVRQTCTASESCHRGQPARRNKRLELTLSRKDEAASRGSTLCTSQAAAVKGEEHEEEEEDDKEGPRSVRSTRPIV